MIQRLSLGCLACSLIFLMVPGMTLGFSDGPPPAVNGSVDSNGATCRACHGMTVGMGSVQILGLPQFYFPNELFNLTVRITDSVQAGAGFQISAEDADGNHMGTMIVSDPVNTQFNEFVMDDVWINHTLAGYNTSLDAMESGDSADYVLQWQAPASFSGAVTFYAVGNAVNGNGNTGGDLVYTTSSTVLAGDMPIPAVSQWGIVVMVLGLMVSASLVMRKHRLSMSV